MRRVKFLAVLVAGALLVAGCGSSSSDSSSSTSGSSAPAQTKTLTVDAAASLTEAFGSLATTFQQQNPGWKVATNFDGTDVLAAQVENGQQADVFAGASPKYPEELQQKNLLGPTKNFATNSLVLIVPASNPAHITSVDDLTKDPKPKLVVGDESVPIGTYTQTVLENLGINESDLNIVSKEPDVKSIVAKVVTGDADAGFVYVTDAKAAGDKVKPIGLPADANATAIYPIGVLTGSTNSQAAQKWIDLVMSSQGQAVLKQYGFGAAP